MPPLAEGFSDRPDTAGGILDALIPGSTIALVPGSEFAEGKQNWLGAAGKTQTAVMLAETLWRSGAVEVVVWISATSRSAVLSGYVEAWLAATGRGAARPPRTVAGRPRAGRGRARPNRSRLASSAASPSPASRGWSCSTTCRAWTSWTGCG